MTPLRNSRASQSKRRPPRTGSLYVPVLGVTVIVSMMVLSAAHVARLHLKSTTTGSDRYRSRLLAASAIEHAITELRTNSNWETDYALSAEYPSPAPSFDDDTFAWKLESLGGSKRRLDGVGRAGTAKCMFSVDLARATSLDCGLLVDGDLIVDGNCSITVDRAIVATNGALNSQGSITAPVEAQTVTAAGIMNGTLTVPGKLRQLPNPETIFDYYLAHGTVIAPPGAEAGEISNVLLSPTSNPYGSPNADGIYIVDGSAGDLKVQKCRVVGTLVVKNVKAGKLVKVEKSVSWEPAYPSLPALLVEGDLEIKLDVEPLVESTTGANLNPMGTPYQGQTDVDQVDSYPSAIAGLIYCSADLTLDGGDSNVVLDIQGMIMAGGACKLTKKINPEIRYDATVAAAPGFGGTLGGPSEVRSYTGSATASDDIQSDKRWGQYFKPNLPANALCWRVTSVDVWVSQEGSPGNLDVGLHLPDASHMPDVKIDEASVPGTALSWIFAWYNVSFSHHQSLDPNQGLCLTLTSKQNPGPAHIWYRNSGVSEPDSALLTGDASGWLIADTTGSLRYRVHAVYVTADGEINIEPGSWRQTTPP